MRPDGGAAFNERRQPSGMDSLFFSDAAHGEPAPRPSPERCASGSGTLSPMTPDQLRTYLEKWHRLFEPDGISGLDALLDDDVVFHSPVVHRPLEGKAITYLYLMAASQTLVGERFRYVRELVDPPHAVLEFETEIDGVHIDGVDMMTWNDAGKIVDFKVMVRPHKAVEKVRQIMADMLSTMSP